MVIALTWHSAQQRREEEGEDKREYEEGVNEVSGEDHVNETSHHLPKH